MCRIAGIISSQNSVDSLQHKVSFMCETQKHGGPDDEGIYTDPEYPVVFGHRRLSLIDLSPGGHQPMRYADDQLIITYNGELYNYLQLKEDLKRMGFVFKSTSDTEVILAAFSAWGVMAFKRFAGMFAFALFDRQNNTVYLVRDQTGIKPLYFSLYGGGLYFASEVKALGSLPELQINNEAWPVYFMAYGHLPEPITTLKHVKPLSKGCYLQYDVLAKTSEFHSYAHLGYLEKLDKKDEVLDRLRQCLKDSIGRHLLSDAPIGAFLSGGIDSSLIALLAGETVKEKLTTLSIYFSEQQYSEKQYQDIIAEKLNGDHRAFCLTETDFSGSLPAIMDAMDLPSNDGINTWFISKYAKESGLKAVLSGLGGDELFGGYPSFNRLKKTAYLQQLPANALRAGRYSTSKKIKRLAYLSLPGIKGKYLFLRGQFIPSEIARSLGIAEEQVWSLLEEQPGMPVVNHLTFKNQASWMEMNLYMQNQLLRDSDVMSMAHGIEIRVPFLDLDFVKFALQIQSEIKYEGGGKRLLVEAFEDILPNAIYNRSKMGFSFPFQEWLAKNEWVKDQMKGTNGEMGKTYTAFLKGERHWSQVMSLVLVQNHQVAKEAALSYA
ncbi:MAG TPA: asparagine synthase (glutamine-hydrolyzing) [Flavisolibacter sp.]|jgi:asparagine synthase (glutamine-hydrolysing)|nr:asparagine synthase (glutamine-hydrolyzing) [Flavisolibacter sp.]